jgi:hypothetical protein
MKNRFVHSGKSASYIEKMINNSRKDVWSGFFLVLMQDTFDYMPVENGTSVVHSLIQEKYFYPPYSTQPIYEFLMH